MKKLSLLLGILFLGIIVKGHGNHGKSKLNLKLWNNTSFKVTIDNHSYEKTTNLHLGNLAPGIHHVKIIKRKHNHQNQSGFYQVLYNGTIKIPQNANVMAVVTPHKTIKIKVIKNHHNHHEEYGSSSSGGCNYYGACTPTCGSFYGDEYGGYSVAMDKLSFNRLLNSVQNETFDDNRLSLLALALKSNKLNTEQVIVLMEQFTFDSSKLSFAKMAYSSTVDKENYYLVNNGFTFSSSKNELIEYINKFA